MADIDSGDVFGIVLGVVFASYMVCLGLSVCFGLTIYCKRELNSARAERQRDSNMNEFFREATTENIESERKNENTEMTPLIEPK